MSDNQTTIQVQPCSACDTPMCGARCLKSSSCSVWRGKPEIGRTAAVARSNVRLQWDHDHDPSGRLLARRAIQLGLRGSVLRAFGKRELMEVIDMTQFVATQRQLLQCAGVAELRTPVERPYVPSDPSIARRLQLD